jgi:hypothetical protein
MRFDGAACGLLVRAHSRLRKSSLSTDGERWHASCNGRSPPVRRENQTQGRMKHRIDLAHVHTELCHALTLERCAIRVYRAALPHAPSARDWARWSVALDGARANEAALLRIFDELALAPCRETPQRAAIDAVADLLVGRLEQASNAARAAAAHAAVKVMERREQLDWRLFAGLVAPRSARASEMPRSRGRGSNRTQSRRATPVPALAA